MSSPKKIPITVDGKKYDVPKNINLVEALSSQGIRVPTLCWYKGMDDCLGTCRVCTVNVNGRPSAACTLNTTEEMKIEFDTSELNDLRKSIIELLFVEGNHYCPSCEKSGDCLLQAEAQALEMTHSRFPYEFNHYEIDYSGEMIILERNRCVHCKRCTELFTNDDGEKVFSFIGKGKDTQVVINKETEKSLSKHKAQEAMDLCPVGAILVKGEGFKTPYGERKFEKEPLWIKK
ncbi:MAG: (2Fe-2S)-binding protein [Bacteriovoracaceae bacterium]|nr:(2Fe-2S)-binding protein [Bacteriovoracaceae bacterium]